MLIDLKVLASFLKEANKRTYASKDAIKAKSSRLNSEDYHYEKDGLAYHDTYFGNRNFIGEEIVYQSGEPAWGANYFGFVISSEISEKGIYSFLRQALIRDGDGIIPVRGPSHFVNDDWEYRFSADGDLRNFSGKEDILFKKVLVYTCLVHGGSIK